MWWQSTNKSGDVVEMMVSANKKEQKSKCELMKQLIQSLYFLVKYHMPHTTTFDDAITLQIDIGLAQLEAH